MRSVRVAYRATATNPRLVICWIKFLLGQFRRCTCSAQVALPQDCAQTSAIGSAKIPNEIINLRIGNFCRDAVHSRWPIQRLAQGGGLQSATFPRSEDCQPARIKI